MKKLLFSTLSVLLLTAYTSNTTPANGITPEGVGIIKVGMNLSKVPESVENLYDHIEIVTTPESYNEMDDETIPAYDTYYFMLDGEKMFHTVPNGDGTIPYLSVTSDKLSYKGISPNMSCREVLTSDAKLIAWGPYGSCEFFCCYRMDVSNIEIVFPLSGEGSFSQQGYEKLCKNTNFKENSYYELDLVPEDFREDATISEIIITGK